MAATLASLGTLLTGKGDLAGAEPLLTEAVNWRRKSLPAGHRAIGDAEAALGECLLRQSKLIEAEPLLRSALQSAPAHRGGLLYDRGAVVELLAMLYQRSGRPADARAVRASRPGQE
jgi:tetratricopeptide (TPR) repeat protein